VVLFDFGQIAILFYAKKGGENKTRVELVSFRLKEDVVNFFGQMVRMLLC
jgi:hypothetical protein